MNENLRNRITDYIDTGASVDYVVNALLEDTTYNQIEIFEEINEMEQDFTIAREDNFLHVARFVPCTSAEIWWNKKYGHINPGDLIILEKDGEEVEVSVCGITMEGQVSGTLIGSHKSKEPNQFTAVVSNEEWDFYNLEDWHILSHIPQEV